MEAMQNLHTSPLEQAHSFKCHQSFQRETSQALRKAYILERWKALRDIDMEFLYQWSK